MFFAIDREYCVCYDNSGDGNIAMHRSYLYPHNLSYVGAHHAVGAFFLHTLPLYPKQKPERDALRRFVSGQELQAANHLRRREPFLRSVL
jgi:hypothetical protein